jgi:hypothetical protein
VQAVAAVVMQSLQKFMQESKRVESVFDTPERREYHPFSAFARGRIGGAAKPPPYTSNSWPKRRCDRGNRELYLMELVWKLPGH